MSGKLVVTPTTGGGSQITLYGSSGKPLMHSDTFDEPRAKGATMRALAGMLDGGVTVEDLTTVRRQPVNRGLVPASARVRTTAATRQRTTGRTTRGR